MRTEDPIATAVSVYPNPANDWLLIETEVDGPLQIQIYDVQGKLVLEEGLSLRQARKVVISSLTSGFYFIEIRKEQKLVGVTRFVRM